MSSSVRVRFAPSPTGPLHIGGVRTALYNWLFAKKMGGSFLLRLEDTDEKRKVNQSVPYLLQSLSWLGIMPDEGYGTKKGNFGPYKQSERLLIYQKYAHKLIEAGKAYYAFDTPQDLDAMRKRLTALGISSPKYNAWTRQSMKNSLSLPSTEVERLLKNKTPYVIRLRINPEEVIRFEDLVRGWIQVKGKELDDKILIKMDGGATYHMANVVDDHLMKITHVIRGEEWLPSTPLHILLYQALGWQQPIWVHLPLLLRSDGKGKLSKRSVEGTKNPVFPLDWEDPVTHKKFLGFRSQGYLPQAVINFLSLLGWHPKDKKELLTLEELIHQFDLKSIGKGGARCDFEKAKWFNHQHFQKVPTEQLVQDYLTQYLTKNKLSQEQLTKICDVVKERIYYSFQLAEWIDRFIYLPKEYDNKKINKLEKRQLKEIVYKVEEAFKAMETFDIDAIKKAIAKLSIPANILLPLLRTILLGVSSGPSVVLILHILGKKESHLRLKKFIEHKSLT